MKLDGAEKVDLARVVDSLGAIREELARLGERVAALEAAPRAAAPPAPAPAASAKAEAAAQPEPLGDELVLVIAAAVAAFLGKKAHIRQIRLLGSNAWAEHGRVTIQASHALSTHHG